MLIIETRVSTRNQLPLKYNSQMIFDTRKVVKKEEKGKEREKNPFECLILLFVLVKYDSYAEQIISFTIIFTAIQIERISL